jgi:8-oxo-dGTP diphosphatase
VSHLTLSFAVRTRMSRARPDPENPQRTFIRWRCHLFTRRSAACCVDRHPRKDPLGLPKGAVGEGETSEAAALREVLEETGIKARIVRMLDTIEYYFRAGETLIHKRVDFYLMEYVEGELQPQLSEVDDVEWVPLSEALTRASFESERKLLEIVSRELSSSTPLPEPSSTTSSSSPASS